MWINNHHHRHQHHPCQRRLQSGRRPRSTVNLWNMPNLKQNKKNVWYKQTSVSLWCLNYIYFLLHQLSTKKQMFFNFSNSIIPHCELYLLVCVCVCLWLRVGTMEQTVAVFISHSFVHILFSHSICIYSKCYINVSNLHSSCRLVVSRVVRFRFKPFWIIPNWW